MAGKVTIDGEPATELGTKVDPTLQKVEVDGFILRPEGSARRYYLLNKPSGVVCTNERRETRPRAIDLITDRQAGRIYTVGRQLVALARVTASEYGNPAPGYQEARELLGLA